MTSSWDIRWRKHHTEVAGGHKCSMKWPWLYFSQNSISIDTALSTNIPFHGERQHRHPESVSEANTSFLETNICWVPELQLPRKEIFKSKSAPFISSRKWAFNDWNQLMLICDSFSIYDLETLIDRNNKWLQYILEAALRFETSEDNCKRKMKENCIPQ